MRQNTIRVKFLSLLLIIILGALALSGCSAAGLEASSGELMSATKPTSNPESTTVNATTTSPAAAGANTINGTNSATGTTPDPSSTGAAATTAATTAPATTTATSPAASGASPAGDGTPAGKANEDAEKGNNSIQSFRGDGTKEDEGRGKGSGKNIVQLVNKENGQMLIRGSTQLNKIWGPNVTPLNLATSQGSCTDCQTYAVALQINLISRKATNIAPENAAIAVNIGCTRCQTYAQALQYTFQVDDPSEVPPRINGLLKRMEREINSLKTKKGVTFAEARTRIADVIAEFKDLAASLNKQERESREDDDDNATPIPTQTPEPSVTPAPTATPAGSSGADPSQATTPTVAPASSAGSTTAPQTTEPTTAASTAPPGYAAPNAAPAS
jgi:hypothetical protein